jgi:hypothetical protein
MSKRVPLAVLAAMMILAAPAGAAEPALDWSSAKTVAPDAIIDVDCPTATLCVAVDAGGNVITSVNPTGPATDWTAADVIDSSLHAVSCASPSLCVAVSTAGQLVTSTDPTGGAAAWTTTKVGGVGYLGAVSCAVGVCAALDAEARILLSSDPTGGAGAWTIGEPSGGSLFLSAVDCSDSSLCVAVGAEPHNLGGGLFVQENVVFTIADPVGPGRQFKKSYVGPRSFMQAISCPTTSFCLAVDKWGEAWSSTDPTGGGSAWSSQFIDPEENLTDVSCPSSSFCVAVDDSGQALTSTNPTGGLEAWGVTAIPSGMLSISCPSTSLCLAAGSTEVTSGIPTVPVQTEPSQPSAAAAPTPAPIYPASLFLQPTALPVSNGKAKMTLTCLGPYVCSGVARLEVAKGRGSGVSARGSYQSIGSTRFLIKGRTVVAVPLNKHGRQLTEEKKQIRTRVRINGQTSTGQALFLQKFATLKRRG